MTNREFFESVINGNVTAETVEHAKSELAALEKKNQKAREKAAEKAKENDPLKEQIVEFLRIKPNVSSEIGSAIGVSTSKASYLCRDMVADGVLSVSETKSPTSKGKVKLYTLVKIATEDAEEDGIMVEVEVEDKEEEISE